MERPQLKKMKKRCAIPEKKLKELESILQQAIALPLPDVNEEEDDYGTEHRRFVLCEEIDQRSFFLHSLLKAEMSSLPSPPSEEGHLINIQRCFDTLHDAYHEWTENSDPTLVQHYLGSDRPEPECTASCFNTDVEDEEEEEDEEIGEPTESIVSTQTSENPMELECCDDVRAVVPAAEMVSVGVQTDSLLLDEEEEEEKNEVEKMKSTNCFIEVTENPVSEEYDDELEAEAEGEEEEEALVGASAAVAVAKGVVWMGCGTMMMMGFMIGRFYYYGFFHSNGCCFDYYYYYCYSRVGGGGGLLPT